MGFTVRLVLFFRCVLHSSLELLMCNRQSTPADSLPVDGTSELDDNITIQMPNGPKQSALVM